MLFGLHRTATIFQRLTNRVLQPHDRYMAAYIDDTGLQRQLEDHLQHLTRVFEALSDTGLMSNPTKYHLGKKEVTYLRYKVEGGKLQPLTNKVQALSDIPVLTTKRQVNQFLGLTGYYRHFVSSFTTIVAPLSVLTRSSQPW